MLFFTDEYVMMDICIKFFFLQNNGNTGFFFHVLGLIWHWGISFFFSNLEFLKPGVLGNSKRTK